MHVCYFFPGCVLHSFFFLTTKFINLFKKNNINNALTETTRHIHIGKTPIKTPLKRSLLQIQCHERVLYANAGRPAALQGHKFFR